LPKQEFIKIGTVGKAHGLQGAIKIHFISNPDAVDALDYFFIQKYDEKPIPYFIEELAWMDAKGKAMARLEDVDSKEKADALFKHSVLAPYHSSLVNLNEMLEMLVGFTLIDANTKKEFEIVEVYTITNNPLLELKLEKTTVLVPYNEQFVSKLDTKNKRIEYKIPGGLLD
jgi:16S rRNA processing protein RimM